MIVWFAAKEKEELRKNSPATTVDSRAKTEEARIQREAMRKELLGEK